MSDRLYKLNKTKQDIEYLLNSNKKLIYRVLSDMNLLTNQGAESAGWQGLWDAINTFDVFSSTAFATYAYTVIRNEILNELRVQNRQIPCISVDCLEDLYSVVDFEEAANLQHIYKIFDAYIKDKTGLNKNILLVWYSSNFESTVGNIANICGCSSSYVSRVQGGFRAYISSKLQEG